MRQTSFGLLLLLALLLTGAGQVLPQGVVGHGGWELDRVIGRGTVEDLAVSPDGSALAVAGSHGIWIYSLPALELLRHIDAGNWLFDVAWSPNSRFVAAGGRNDPALYHLLYGQPMADEPALTAGYHSIRIWDVASGTLIRKLQDSDFTARFAWSPAGDMLAAVSHDGVLRIHDVAGGAGRVLFEGFAGLIMNIDWAPDGQGIALPTEFDLFVLDASPGDILSYTFLNYFGEDVELAPANIESFLESIRRGDYSPPESPLALSGSLQHAECRHAVWSPDGAKIATNDMRSGVMGVWQPPVAKALFIRASSSSCYHHTAPVWSPDGRMLAQATDRTVHILDSGSGDRLHLLRHQVPPYPQPDYDYGITGIAWSADGLRLATAGNDERVVVFDAIHGASLVDMTHDADVQDLAWPRDREFLVSATSTGDIHVWNVRDGRQLAMTGEHGRATPLYLLRHSSWGPDSRRLYAAGRYLDASTGQPVPSANWPHGVIPSRDHRMIADPLQKVWTVIIRNAETLEPVQELEHDFISQQDVSSIVWSPDGSRIVFWNYGISLVSRSVGFALWHLDAVPERTALFEDGSLQSGKRHQYPTLAWSPDGKLLAMNPESPAETTGGNVSSSVLLRETTAGALSMPIPTQTSRMNSLDWSPDGVFLAGGGDDGSLLLWDMDWYGPRPVLAWNTQKVVNNHVVNALAWSPDGTKLAVGTASLGDPLPGAVLVYNWKNGALENVARLPGHAVGIVSLAWSPDGSRLASTDLGGVVHVWRRATVG